MLREVLSFADQFEETNLGFSANSQSKQEYSPIIDDDEDDIIDDDDQAGGDSRPGDNNMRVNILHRVKELIAIENDEINSD